MREARLWPLVYVLVLHGKWQRWPALLCGSDNGRSLTLQTHRTHSCFSTTRSSSGIVSEVRHNESSDQQVLQPMRHEAIVCRGINVDRKLPYWAGASICGLWAVTLFGAYIWIYINKRLNSDSTTNLVLCLVGFGLFFLGVFLVSTVTKDYSE
jgi:hypothetical protein